MRVELMLGTVNLLELRLKVVAHLAGTVYCPVIAVIMGVSAMLTHSGSGGRMMVHLVIGAA
jgi:hypothetical protein